MANVIATILVISDEVRSNWNELMLLLRDSTADSLRKVRIDTLAPIDSALEELDYNRAVEYLLAVSRFTLEIDNEQERNKFRGYFTKKFCTVINHLETFLESENSETFNRTFDLYHLLSTVWRSSLKKTECYSSIYNLEGKLFEEISKYSDELSKPMHLEKSRQSYFKGGDIENAERVARLKSECVKNCTISFSKTQLPYELETQINEDFEKRLKLWYELPANDKFGHLVHDILGFIPNAFDLNRAKAECNDPLLLLREESDICISMRRDRNTGRTSNSTAPISFFLQDYENFNRTLQRYTLTLFTKPLKEWLCTEVFLEMQDGNHVTATVLHQVLQAIKDNSFVSESTLHGLEEGLVAYVNGYYRYSLSVLLPLFEGALRERVISEGLWVIKHEESESLEKYFGLEKVMEKSVHIFGSNLLEFFNKWFSTKDGVGLNLRNDHCHGILPHESYCDWIATGTVLCYFFLCQPKKRPHFEFEETDELIDKGAGDE